MIIPSILTFLVIVVLLALGGGAVVLIAYGIGWLIHLIAGFDLFQSTLLGLAGIFAFGILAERMLSGILSIPKTISSDEDEYDDEFDDEFEDEFEEEEEEQPNLYPGIPRWRQPLKQVDFSKAQPNDKCPCGSGRKFKNCHGRKTAGN